MTPKPKAEPMAADDATDFDVAYAFGIARLSGDKSDYQEACATLRSYVRQQLHAAVERVQNRLDNGAKWTGQERALIVDTLDAVLKEVGDG